ncbi:elongation of very long chain fatty acids protein 7 [Harpegnathos saltator]|uniref:elongation of very long chain fatty acids protein 7 n=1 Tax=Harpegnathos saltator TaxID=610380 RepID=UPI000DBED8BE|nr:elongation of very long chain fatty acids protein 7 [Harpegnathos saltator]
MSNEVEYYIAEGEDVIEEDAMEDVQSSSSDEPHTSQRTEESSPDKPHKSQRTEDYEPPQKVAAMDLVPYDVKLKIVMTANEHPNWSFRTLQSKFKQHLHYHSEVARFRKYILSGGNYWDKLQLIKRNVYDRFTEAREQRQLITRRLLQQWTMAAAVQYNKQGEESEEHDKAFRFVASNTWLTSFLREYKISNRRVVRYLSKREIISPQAVMESAVHFQELIRSISPDYDPDFIINSDQTDCEYRFAPNQINNVSLPAIFETGSQAIHPRTKDFFLIDTLWRVPLLAIFYVYSIYVLLPKFMEKREPYKLTRILQIYNVLQIIFNMYLFYMALALGWLREYSFNCEPVDFSYAPRALQISRVVWYYFMLKVVDLLDTFFFVLRKKQSQVSFLHIYHHCGMVILTWGATKYFPGGHGTFTGLINTFVHSIMYTHYLLSSMKIDTKSWKKHITQLQMLQFFILAYHISQLLWTDCGFPRWSVLLLLPQYIFMLVLFAEFYYNAYIKKKPASAAVITNMETYSIPAEISNGKLKER